LLNSIGYEDHDVLWKGDDDDDGKNELLLLQGNTPAFARRIYEYRDKRKAEIGACKMLYPEANFIKT
jgi:hypothetical protein